MANPFVILMSARSGSTWFVTLLNGQPGVAAYEELLLPHPVKEKYAWLAEGAPERFFTRGPSLAGPRPARLNRYLAEVESHDPAAAASGFKVNAAQLRGVPELAAVLALRGYRLILLVRDNVFDSSMSQIMVSHGGDAHGREAGHDAPAITVDPADVVARIRRRLRWNAAMHAVKRCWPRPSMTIGYEELVSDQEAAMNRTLRFMGVDGSPLRIESPLRRRAVRPYRDRIANFDAVKRALDAAGLGRHAPTD